MRQQEGIGTREASSLLEMLREQELKVVQEVMLLQETRLLSHARHQGVTLAGPNLPVFAPGASAPAAPAASLNPAFTAPGFLPGSKFLAPKDMEAKTAPASHAISLCQAQPEPSCAPFSAELPLGNPSLRFGKPERLSFGASELASVTCDEVIIGSRCNVGGSSSSSGSRSGNMTSVASSSSGIWMHKTTGTSSSSGTSDSAAGSIITSATLASHRVPPAEWQGPLHPPEWLLFLPPSHPDWLLPFSPAAVPIPRPPPVPANVGSMPTIVNNQAAALIVSNQLTVQSSWSATQGMSASTPALLGEAAEVVMFESAQKKTPWMSASTPALLGEVAAAAAAGAAAAAAAGPARAAEAQTPAAEAQAPAAEAQAQAPAAEGAAAAAEAAGAAPGEYGDGMLLYMDGWRDTDAGGDQWSYGPDWC
ncbi:hypothetical protein CLOM_g3209 [Closterium sp. NIES-68]|nr:hypothetical protein CLOM_g3209 [Closterium sp. NIES-68]